MTGWIEEKLSTADCQPNVRGFLNGATEFTAMRRRAERLALAVGR